MTLGSYLNIKSAGENIEKENSNTNNLENEYEKIAKIAEEINVIIFASGVTGTGVILENQSNDYVIITSWHVVKGIENGDETLIRTFDGELHSIIKKSIKKIKNVDLAILRFESKKEYKKATIGDDKNLTVGEKVFVFGYPLPNSTIENRIGRFISGTIASNKSTKNLDGYGILYTNPTLPGMSGGSLLNRKGELIGIHGLSEKDDDVSLSLGKSISTGFNLAIPISLFSEYKSELEIFEQKKDKEIFNEYIINSENSYKRKNYIEAIEFAEKSLRLKKSSKGFYILGKAKYQLGDPDSNYYFEKALDLDNNYLPALKSLVNSIGYGPYADNDKAILIYNKLINLKPLDSQYLLLRSLNKFFSADFEGHIKDLERGIKVKAMFDFQCSNLGKLSSSTIEERINRVKKQIECNTINEYHYLISLRYGAIKLLTNRTNEACEIWNKLQFPDGYHNSFLSRAGLDRPYYYQGEKIKYFHIPYSKINSNFFEDYNKLANILFKYNIHEDELRMKLRYEYCKN